MRIECVANIWWINAIVSSSVALLIWNYILLSGRSTPQSEVNQRVGREKGGGLGSTAPTRQLNAPWAWWISNWRLITSEVCWIIVSVMNRIDRAWQISAVTPLPEPWWQCVWMAVCMSLCPHYNPWMCVYRLVCVSADVGMCSVVFLCTLVLALCVHRC